jgi:hypothetical protein
VLGHEVDGLGRDELRGHEQIAFVLAIFFVYQDDHAPASDLGDDLRDTADAHPHLLVLARR